jgi:phthalate 4,5-dioxygenase oxygenase subunit
MTSARENELLTGVGPGTPMGNLMRQYWLPTCLSSELAADGDPLRLMLLGELLISFRDTAGRVGVMDHLCPHRGASLFYGRNEQGGLRCVYHGWKFDEAGYCTDMPNLPADQDFRHKVMAKAYQAAERGGLVYVYMGAREVNATGCRLWKVTSTTRISAFCTAGKLPRRTLIQTIWNVSS